jgi:hypothetical protein
VRRKKGWVFEYVIFTMGHELAIPLRIRGTLVAKLRESAGDCWPVEETWAAERGSVGRAVLHLLSHFWLACRSWHFWQRLLVGVADRLWQRTQTPAMTSRS